MIDISQAVFIDFNSVVSKLWQLFEIFGQIFSNIYFEKRNLPNFSILFVATVQKLAPKKLTKIHNGALVPSWMWFEVTGTKAVT